MEPNTGKELGRGKMAVRYPSGKSFAVEGQLHFGRLPDVDGGCLVVLPDDKSALVLDPRAMVAMEDKIVYHPRAYWTHLAAWAKEWLDEHPEWAPVASPLEGCEAPGAWPKGTRIRKSLKEPGDGHDVGALGTVIGSALVLDRCMYSIAWDDSPNVAVHCLGHKIDKA